MKRLSLLLVVLSVICLLRLRSDGPRRGGGGGGRRWRRWWRWWSSRRGRSFGGGRCKHGRSLALDEPTCPSTLDSNRIAPQRISRPTCRSLVFRLQECRNRLPVHARAPETRPRHWWTPPSTGARPGTALLSGPLRASCRTSWMLNRRAVQRGPARFRHHGQVTWRVQWQEAWPAVRPPSSCAIQAPVPQPCPPLASARVQA